MLSMGIFKPNLVIITRGDLNDFFLSCTFRSSYKKSRICQVFGFFSKELSKSSSATQSRCAISRPAHTTAVPPEIVQEFSSKPFPCWVPKPACIISANVFIQKKIKPLFALPCQLELPPPYLGSATASSARLLSQPNTVEAEKSSAFHNLLLLPCRAGSTLSATSVW